MKKMKLGVNNGYADLLIANSKYYRKLINETKEYIARNEKHTTLECYTVPQQNEKIIDDFVSTIYVDLGGK